MPIYAYRCDACGHAKDVLQKISDPLLDVCPACGAASFKKQVTAAGFQLKGSGWYVTDFRNGQSGASTGDKPAGDAKPSTEGAATSDVPATKAAAAGTDGTSKAAPAVTPAATPSSSAGSAGTPPATSA